MSLVDGEGLPFVVDQDMKLLVRSSSETGGFADSATAATVPGAFTATIPANGFATTVFYLDTAAGTIEITASAAEGSSAVAGTGSLDVIPGEPEQIKIASDPIPTQPGEVSAPIVVQTEDEYGNQAPIGEDIAIEFSTTSPTGAFDTDPDGDFDGSVESALIHAGDSGVEIYYLDTEIGDPVIGFDENPEQGWEPLTQVQPIRLTLVVNNLGTSSIAEVNENELTTEDNLVAPSPEGQVVIGIEARTNAANADGSRLEMVIVEFAEEELPQPKGQRALGEVLDLGPDGATFDPPIVVGVRYEESDLPRGVSADQLTFGFWDGEQWVEVSSTVDPETQTVIAELSHFSQYTVISPNSPWYYTVPGLLLAGALPALAAGFAVGGRANYRLKFVGPPERIAVGERVNLRLEMRNAMGKIHGTAGRVPVSVTIEPHATLSGDERLTEVEGSNVWSDWAQDTEAGGIFFSAAQPGTYTIKAKMTKRIGPLNIPLTASNATFKVVVA